ncbi:tripartite tricarboxylate transporter substrate binding protein BugD [Pigmentiphaga sp. H8]|uniref:tripartite tricarboxylate transporter substrate binding protein BugD n=1 Tax=Pigmentiphaga sp. H8 TaxID=2488560 RepID=UPI000F5A0D2D|nr:tripartite tricarboxylate transporter substrate binding protein BugD [Pigmentiphaga sp. H8]AZG09330.1 tripartite tricarboxylate transporter substrate binding protein BugD [Pigmentiphaga sp. H8]
MAIQKKAVSAAIGAAALASAAVLGPAQAMAQGYPTRPVTMIVPFAAGGPTDVVARSLAEAMRKSLGQTVVVENVGGAGGTIGTARVAKASNDGYTMLLMHIGFSTAPALYRKLSYDQAHDFQPVGLTVDVPMTIIARENFPATNIKEFLTYVKANASKLSMANAGIGSASHLCGLMFMSTIGSEFQTIPYKGTAPAMNDLLGKQVDFMCDQTTNTTGQIKAGKVKAYAVTSKTRVPSLPDLPTLDESGLKDFSVGIWHGLWVPKGTSPEIVTKLQTSLKAGLDDPAFKQRMTELGAIVLNDKATPAALDALVKSETAKWGAVIKKAGVYAD